MVIAELVFGLPRWTPEAQDAVDFLLACWLKNGQIAIREWSTIREPRRLRVIASLPDRGALSARHSNKYARRGMKALASHGCKFRGVRVLGDDPTFAEPCTCKRPPSLILFLHFLLPDTSVRCGGCFHPVPLYRLPHIHDEEHSTILRWADDYRACDTLQLGCVVGERFGERQMAEVDSALSRDGRDICRELAARVGAPVYYNLFKSRGISERAELQRRCPSCGGRWLLKEPWHGLFEFRCDKCSLVSNVASSLSR